MDREEKLKYIIKYYFSIKNPEWNPSKKKFNLVAKYNKDEADKILRLGKHFDKIKSKIDRVAEWAESRDISWSLSTVIKKWAEIENLKPKKEKKKPYFRGERMYERNGRWFVIPNDGGEHKEFVGSEDNIEWK